MEAFRVVKQCLLVQKRSVIIDYIRFDKDVRGRFSLLWERLSDTCWQEWSNACDSTRVCAIRMSVELTSMRGLQ